MPRANARADAQEGDDTVIADLVVNAEEDENRHAEISAGWSSAALLLGSVEYVDENVFGTGLMWGVELGGSFRGYRPATRIVDRFLLGLGSRLELQLAHSLELRESYSDLATGADLRANLPVAPDLRLESDFRFSVASLGLSGAPIGSQVSYVRPAAGFTAHIQIADGAVFSVQTDAESILPVGQSEIPISERLYAGGSESVRSFSQDAVSPLNADGQPVGGLTRVEGTLELRARVIADAYIAFFYDVGVVAADPVSLATPGHAVGMGLRYRLPVGPLRLDVGVNPGLQFADENPWALHFAIGSGL